jgi:hypothetical protein
MLVTPIGEVDALVQDFAKGLKGEFYSSMKSRVKIVWPFVLERWIVNAVQAFFHVILLCQQIWNEWH